MVGEAALVALALAAGIAFERSGRLAAAPRGAAASPTPVASATTTPIVAPSARGRDEVAEAGVVIVFPFLGGAQGVAFPAVLVGDARHVLVRWSMVQLGDAWQVARDPRSGAMLSTRASVVAYDEASDLAMLYLKDPMGEPVPLATSAFRPGEETFVVAFGEADWEVRLRPVVIKAWSGTPPPPRGSGAGLAFFDVDDWWSPARGSVALDPQGALRGLGSSPTYLSPHLNRDQIAGWTTLTTPVSQPLPKIPTRVPTPEGGLPYKAWGEGLRPGQTVEAMHGSVMVGRTTADRDGNWSMNILAKDVARGEVIALWLDGKATGHTFIFVPGLFSPPPGGLMLAGPTPTPTPSSNVAPTSPQR
ncbi:MAG: hypothetical protein AB7G21_13280 [Dehalococcoidia bacterium]